MIKDVCKVWIVDDDSHFASYLEKMLENQPTYEVSGMSYDLEQAYSHLQHIDPHLVTIDLSLPDGSGVELVKWLEKHKPETKKLIISFWGQEDLVYEAITHGADGYLQKDHLLTMEMSNAIETLESGGTPISPKLAKRFLAHFDDKEIPDNVINTFNANAAAKNTDETRNDLLNRSNTSKQIDDLKLSKREQQVLELLTEGLSYNEIADQLHISYHTVSSHMKKIYKKLNVTSKVQAIMVAKDIFTD